MPPSKRPPFCHDGTERRICRPQDADDQKCYFSGKKKCHTIKNLLLIDANLHILFLSDTYEGSAHDKRIADATPYPLPDGSALLQDLGFLAFSLEGVTCRTPHKKPRGGKLTDEQKAENQAHSKRRVRIEHVNSSVKRCRILKDTIRLLRENVRDMVAEIGCALYNRTLASYTLIEINSIEHIICSVKRLRIVKDTIRLTKDTVRDMVIELAVSLHNFRLRLNPWPTYY